MPYADERKGNKSKTPENDNPNVNETRKLVYWLRHRYSPFIKDTCFKCSKRMKSKEEPRE